MHAKPSDKFKAKKKIRINSLEAAICNVALFKSMKDKQFRDTIFISYCEQGVILQAVSQQQWKKAHDYIESFLHHKKIQLLTDGFDKDAYEGLINKGLKEITRKIRQSEQECPYINIIHYQKLRKSCEYMDKQHYVQPLKDWQKKNKRNPNFAFLIVQPKHKFDQIKRNLLQYLLGETIPMKTTILQPIQFIHLLCYSPIKQSVRQNCIRKQIQIFIQKQKQKQKQKSKDQLDDDSSDNQQIQQNQQNNNKSATKTNTNNKNKDNPEVIKATNFTTLNLNNYIYSIIDSKSKISKSGVGLELISSSQIKTQIKNAKLYCKDNPTQIIQACIAQIQKQYGVNFGIVMYKREQQQKYRTLIQKYTNAKFSKEQIHKKIQSHKVYQYEQVQFLGEIVQDGISVSISGNVNNNNSNNTSSRTGKRKYRSWRVCINNCPFLVHQYAAASLDMDTFVIYLDQLQNFYCTYLCRYHGLIIKSSRSSSDILPMSSSSSLTLTAQKQKQKQQQISYMIVFDYHRTTISDLITNNMILDNMQIATMVLHLLYLVNYLHNGEQPRCLGEVEFGDIYWPMAVVLPYLGAMHGLGQSKFQAEIIEKQQQPAYTIENDIKQIGHLLQNLLYPSLHHQSQSQPQQKQNNERESSSNPTLTTKPNPKNKAKTQSQQKNQQQPMQQQDQQLNKLYLMMIQSNKSNRISVKKCIEEFENILCL